MEDSKTLKNMMQKLVVKFLQEWPLLIPVGTQVQYYGLLVSVHAIPSANIIASRQSLLFVMNILCLPITEGRGKIPR